MRGLTPFYCQSDLDSALAAERYDEDTQAFIRALAEDGGALLDLGNDAVSLCDQVIAETEPYFADGAVSRVQDAWYRSPAVKRLATLPKIQRALKSAYGREPFAFQTLNFRQGSQQHFHSDTIHFDSVPAGFMCGVWIALEDVEPDAGPLMYKMGSHRLPVLNMQDVGVNDPNPTYDDYARQYVPRFEEQLSRADLPTTVLTIKKGQAFVWTSNLAHGGQPIVNPTSTRRSLVVHFYFKDCVYFTPMTSNLSDGRLTRRLPPNIRTGLWTWPKNDGRLAPMPLKALIIALQTRIAGRPALF